MPFVDNSCWFKSGLPGDMCDDYIDGSCSSFNFVKAFVLVGIQQGKRQVFESLKEVADREFELEGRGWREMLKWLWRPRQYRESEDEKMKGKINRN